MCYFICRLLTFWFLFRLALRALRVALCCAFIAALAIALAIGVHTVDDAVLTVGALPLALCSGVLLAAGAFVRHWLYRRRTA